MVLRYTSSMSQEAPSAWATWQSPHVGRWPRTWRDETCFYVLWSLLGPRRNLPAAELSAVTAIHHPPCLLSGSCTQIFSGNMSACLFYILSFTPLAVFFSFQRFRKKKQKTNMISCLFLLHCIMDFNITSGGRNSVQETHTTLALLWSPAKAGEDILGRHQSIRGTPDLPRSTKFHIYDRSSPWSVNTWGASWSTLHVDMARTAVDSTVSF
jgi:hypothetical protein